MKKLYSKVMNKLGSISSDKLLHFIVGNYVGQIATLLAMPHCHNILPAAAIGIASGIVIGIAKEIFDKIVMKEPGENKDAIATSIGAIIGTLIVSLL